MRTPGGQKPNGGLLTLAEPPTAIFAHSDEIAFGVLRILRRAGLRVPEDVSVIGVDDHPFSQLVDLTTVGQDVLKQGMLAAQLVIGAMSGDAPPPSTILPVRLVPRGSTAAPSV